MNRRIIIAASIGLTLLSQSSSAQDQESGLKKIEELSGKEIYTQFCYRCHGEDGKGNIPEEMIQNMEAPPPDLTDPYFSSSEKRRSWLNVIKYGGNIEGLSMSMPAWGDALSDKQIEETVDYLKSFVDQTKYPQGELNFIRPHFVTKAFVEQEALIIPTLTTSSDAGSKTTNLETILYYANRFAGRFQYEAKLPIQSITSPSRNESGIGDLELELKYAFHDDVNTTTIAAAGLEVAVPTGSEPKGFGGGTFSVNPYLTAGAELHNLLQLQTTVRVENPLDRTKENPELFGALSTTIVTTESRQGFFPGVEFVARKNLSMEEHSFSVVPKLYISFTKRGHLALSIGSEIPIAGEKPFDTRIVGFFLWEYVDGGLWW